MTPSVESIRSSTGPSAPPDHVLARARWVLLGIFLLNGVTMSSWLARIPSVRDALDMSHADLGVVLLAGAIGALATVTLAGPFVNRFGGRAAFAVSAATFAVAFALLGLGPALGSVELLAAGIFANGVAFALGNVPMNVESAGIERRMGRTILPQFHAAFSIGAVLGTLVGAACAFAGVPVVVQFLVTGVVATLWRVLSIPAIVHDTALRPRPGALGVEEPATPVTGELGDAVVDVETAGLRPGAPASVSRRTRLGAALGAWREPRTLLIGLVIMSAALSEGSANDWLSLAVVDGFDQTEAVGAVVFGVFVGAMTVMRLVGTRLIDRFGRVTILRASGLTSIVGLLLFGFAPSLALAGVGVALWGLGAALAVPLGIAAASDEPLRAASRVSVVSAFASLASLAAPPLLGLAAEAIGARHALVLIAGAMVLSVLLARQVAPLRDVPARPLPGSSSTPPAAGTRATGTTDGSVGDGAVAGDAVPPTTEGTAQGATEGALDGASHPAAAVPGPDDEAVPAPRRVPRRSPRARHGARTRRPAARRSLGRPRRASTTDRTSHRCEETSA